MTVKVHREQVERSLSLLQSLPAQRYTAIAGHQVDAVKAFALSRGIGFDEAVGVLVGIAIAQTQ
jgi:hypothetical protein